MKVLLVEDNDADARLVEFLFRQVRQAEVEILHVQRLGEAIELLRGQQFDALLLDLNLPDSRGLDGLGRLYSTFPVLPIVVFTGTEDEELGREAVRGGAQDYLVKGEVDGWSLWRSLIFAAERKRAELALSQHDSPLSG